MARALEIPHFWNKNQPQIIHPKPLILFAHLICRQAVWSSIHLDRIKISLSSSQKYHYYYYYCQLIRLTFIRDWPIYRRQIIISVCCYLLLHETNWHKTTHCPAFRSHACLRINQHLSDRSPALEQWLCHCHLNCPRILTHWVNKTLQLFWSQSDRPPWPLLTKCWPAHNWSA